VTLTPSPEMPPGAASDLVGHADWSWPTPWIQAPSPAPDTRRAVADSGRFHHARTAGPTALVRLYVEHGQSPWLDGLDRRLLSDGTLARMVGDGIRGVSAGPTGFAAALEDGPDYDEQLSWLISTGCSVEEAYRELVATDVQAACAVLRPVHLTSQGGDGFVSVEIAPSMATRARGAVAAAQRLYQRIDRPNLLVAVPATAPGTAAVRTLVAAGRSVNVTSIFSLSRYSQVIDAYLSGLEAFAARGGDPSTVRGTASFAIHSVDAEADERLATGAGPRGAALCGRVALAQARLAYRLFEERFGTARWSRLARLGAHPQRLLWAALAPLDRSECERMYVDALVAPDTFTALPASTAAAFDGEAPQSGNLLDQDPREAAWVLNELNALGVDLDDVADSLEDQRGEATRRYLDDVMSRLHGWRRNP
jgi:transaldolase